MADWLVWLSSCWTDGWDPRIVAASSAEEAVEIARAGLSEIEREEADFIVSRAEEARRTFRLPAGSELRLVPPAAGLDDEPLPPRKPAPATFLGSAVHPAAFATGSFSVATGPLSDRRMDLR